MIYRLFHFHCLYLFSNENTGLNDVPVYKLVDTFLTLSNP